ncbi:hypothetical protein ECANGB1_679 [Enterospora canceri]|uniref:Uncharacterized protein n=1 Tax=Enterospora canceri TaxID=1081671 RepID=A0A1Y1S8U0_9MICR|nr:hypothetical protein ECANGB1_679 [Enterospora canceri]
MFICLINISYVCASFMGLKLQEISEHHTETIKKIDSVEKEIRSLLRQIEEDEFEEHNREQRVKELNEFIEELKELEGCCQDKAIIKTAIDESISEREIEKGQRVKSFDFYNTKLRLEKYDLEKWMKQKRALLKIQKKEEAIKFLVKLIGIEFGSLEFSECMKMKCDLISYRSVLQDDHILLTDMQQNKEDNLNKWYKCDLMSDFFLYFFKTVEITILQKEYDQIIAFMNTKETNLEKVMEIVLDEIQETDV